MLSAVGLQPLIDSTKEVGKISQPRTVKEVPSFLGSLNYFRQFIPGFAALSAPLSELTKKNQTWKWTTKEEDAFTGLKERLSAAPMLHHSDDKRQTVVHTDASLYAIGGLIGQEYGDEIRPFAYWSRKLNPAETRYPTHERELMAMVKIFEKFLHLLIGRNVEAMTDHRALIHLQTQVALSPRESRWVESLQQYDIQIDYIPGPANYLADYLSRLPLYQPMCTRCSEPIKAEETTDGRTPKTMETWTL